MNFDKKKFLKKLIKKENNLLVIQFSEYSNINQILESLYKIKFHNKLTPLQIKLKLKKQLKNTELLNSLNFDEILLYLKQENLWSELESMEYQINHLLQKFYGYNKIYEKLRTFLYKEELIVEKLQQIPQEIWIKNGMNIIKKMIKNQEMDDSQKYKIYKKLEYEGFREEEIDMILKSL